MKTWQFKAVYDVADAARCISEQRCNSTYIHTKKWIHIESVKQHFFSASFFSSLLITRSKNGTSAVCYF